MEARGARWIGVGGRRQGHGRRVRGSMAHGPVACTSVHGSLDQHGTGSLREGRVKDEKGSNLLPSRHTVGRPFGPARNHCIPLHPLHPRLASASETRVSAGELLNVVGSSGYSLFLSRLEVRACWKTPPRSPLLDEREMAPTTFTMGRLGHVNGQSLVPP